MHTINETKNQQTLAASQSAVGISENFDSATRVIELCNFVNSKGKIFLNGLGLPSERKLKRLKTSQGVKEPRINSKINQM